MSSGFQKVYNTNIHETQINNDFNFESYDFFSSNGLVTDYSFLLKNFNTYSKNSTVYLRESIKTVRKKTIKEKHEARVKSESAKKGKK